MMIIIDWLIEHFAFADAARTATDDRSGQQPDEQLPLPTNFQYDEDDIREDEELIEAVEAVVATAATTVKSEIVNDFNDFITKCQSYIYWMFPIFQQSSEEIQSDLRKLAFSILLCIVIFIVFEPSYNRKRRRRTKRMKARQRRKRAASWTAAMTGGGGENNNGFFAGGSEELATATALDRSSAVSGGNGGNGVETSWLSYYDDQLDDEEYYGGPNNNDFQRFEQQLWPNIISSSRYSKLVLPPTCRLVDKKNIPVIAAAQQQQAAKATMTTKAAAKTTAITKRPKNRREKSARADRDDNNADGDYKNYVNEDNPLQRLKNYVWWVLFLIKSVVSYDLAGAGWTLLLWMQGIRQHRTKNIRGGSNSGNSSNVAGVSTDTATSNMNKDDVSPGVDDVKAEDEEDGEDEDDQTTTDITPVPIDDDENDGFLQQEEKKKSAAAEAAVLADDKKDEEENVLDQQQQQQQQQQQENAEMGQPSTPTLSSSEVDVLPPMPMTNNSNNLTRNVSDGSVYYDLSSFDDDDDDNDDDGITQRLGENHTTAATPVKNKTRGSRSTGRSSSSSPPKSPFANIHRLSLRRNRDRQRRSNPELSALANQRQQQQPQPKAEEKQQQQQPRRRPRTLSLSTATRTGNNNITGPLSLPSRRRAIDELGQDPPESSSSSHRFPLGNAAAAAAAAAEDDDDDDDGDDIYTDHSNTGHDQSNTQHEEYYFPSVQYEPSLAQLSRDVSLPDKNGYILGDEYLPDRRNDTPLLVFVNSRSGPQQGHLLITQLKRLLNPIQIWDLADGNPDAILESFMVFTRLRILVCGGDGTVSWIVSSIDKMFQANDSNNTVYNNSLRLQRGQNRAPKWPPIAILPLGTGNDLARFHGWGGGYNNESLITILEQISESYISLLDRWEVTIEDGHQQEKKKKPSSSVVKKTFFNYLGVGADAQAALQVHNLRESKPGWFFSRLVNKAWYGVFGAEDIIMASSVTVRKEITLFADGVEVELPLDSQGIILLNIDSYAGGVPLWSHGTKVQTSPTPPTTTSAISFRRSRSLSAIQKLDADGFLLEDRPDIAHDLHTILTDEENFDRVTACDQPSSCQDGLLDICSIRGAFHLGQIRVGLSNAQRLCQCREAKIVIKNKVAVQIDGEPWRQRPCTIAIKRKDESAMMLHRSADDSAIETEMSKLLDWAEERRYIDSDVHSVLMKEFSRRIESKTRKRRVREREKNIMLKTLKKAISSGGMNNNYMPSTPPQQQKHQVLTENDSWHGSWEGEMSF